MTSSASEKIEHSFSRWDPRTSSPGTAEEERTCGSVPYLETIAAVHRRLAPAFYLEIGVRHGRSLELARCPAIGVDPAPELKGPPLPPTTALSVMTSDEFFSGLDAEPLPQAPELAFIDGMHWFEYALRDFMNIESLSVPTTLVMIDDIFPSHPAQAERERRTRVWTGDVWKLHRCLAELRPDLFLLPLDTAPTGLLLVAGLDAGNRTLRDRYQQIVEQYGADQAPPPAVLARDGVRVASSSTLDAVLARLKQCRAAGASCQEVASQLRATIVAEGNAA